LLGVAQDAVGLGRLLEPLLGLLVPRVAVGVVLHGQAPVGGLDLLLRGVAGDAEQLVVVDAGVGGHAGLGRCAYHGRSMAWPIRLAARSISASRAFSSSRSLSVRAF